MATTTSMVMTTTGAAMTTDTGVGPVTRAVASIRVRIVVGYLVLLTAALLVAVLLTRQVQLARVDREIEREQAQEVRELQLLADEGIDPATGQPLGDDVRRIFDVFLRRNVPSDDEAFYTVVDGQIWEYSFGSPALFDDPQFLPAWTVDQPTVSTTTSDIDGEVRSLAVPLFVDGSVAGVFAVASFPDDDHGEVADVVRVITLAGLAVLLVTTALAWSLAGRVLRPVRELTATARQITESDLSARIPVSGHDELAELGATFNDMVDRLERGFTSQRAFLDDVAHELRTPITIARGHLEVLGDDPVERAETVEIVTDELDRMSRYVTDLLVLAKAEQPDFLVTERLDLGELALDLYTRVGGLGARRWVLDAAPPVGLVEIVADRERLVQAVTNLAANAGEHTGDGDEIGIGVDASGDRVRLCVRDTGPGIDPSVAPNLFDRQARGAASRARRPDGTGLGLSIVAAIARAHGGTVAVAERPPPGATFVITIPIGTGTWAPPSLRARAAPHAACAAGHRSLDGARSLAPEEEP
jgi:two-component system, OmpR family, sensor kinase